MKKTILLVWYLMCIVCGLQASTKTDSLSAVLISQHDPILKAKTAYRLAYAHMANRSYDQALFYADQCQKYALMGQDPINEAKAYWLQGYVHYVQGNIKNAFLSYLQANASYAAANNKKGEAKTYFDLAILAKDFEAYNNSLSYFEKAESVMAFLPERKQFDLYIQKGDIHLAQDAPVLANRAFDRALKMAQSRADSLKAHYFTAKALLYEANYQALEQLTAQLMPLLNHADQAVWQIRFDLLRIIALQNTNKHSEALVIGKTLGAKTQALGDATMGVTWHYQMARILQTLKQPAVALPHARKASAVALQQYVYNYAAEALTLQTALEKELNLLPQALKSAYTLDSLNQAYVIPHISQLANGRQAIALASKSYEHLEAQERLNQSLAKKALHNKWLLASLIITLLITLGTLFYLFRRFYYSVYAICRLAIITFRLNPQATVGALRSTYWKETGVGYDHTSMKVLDFEEEEEDEENFAGARA